MLAGPIDALNVPVSAATTTTFDPTAMSEVTRGAPGRSLDVHPGFSAVDRAPQPPITGGEQHFRPVGDGGKDQRLVVGVLARVVPAEPVMVGG